MAQRRSFRTFCLPEQRTLLPEGDNSGTGTTIAGRNAAMELPGGPGPAAARPAAARLALASRVPAAERRPERLPGRAAERHLTGRTAGPSCRNPSASRHAPPDRAASEPPNSAASPNSIRPLHRCCPLPRTQQQQGRNMLLLRHSVAAQRCGTALRHTAMPHQSCQRALMGTARSLGPNGSVLFPV